MTSAEEAYHTVELARRMKLHAQIGALETKLAAMTWVPTKDYWVRRRKLEFKIAALKARLKQAEFCLGR